MVHNVEGCERNEKSVQTFQKSPVHVQDHVLSWKDKAVILMAL